ncbi:endonuclease/exonuclease/phosphatase family protein [Thermaerobacter subterraneus]|uniref:endonuclease/exonuclease/phosphatase family protein n=1 Tax=Thermaerobacter subterraneus TaxID=175696 RepID=UPI0012E9DB81|nr:endonuclease/exonuclease/phosphatase family protein [Thermaerobacter subterraneus]
MTGARATEGAALAHRAGMLWRIATFNIRHGRGLDGRVDLEGIRRVLERASPHWAGLQEVDGGRRRSGRVHQARWLGMALGRAWFFHPTLHRGGAYGLCWLGPPVPPAGSGVVAVEAQPLPSRWEPRACLWLRVSGFGPQDEPAWLGVTHLGLGAAERRAQARALAEQAARLRQEGPVVLVGDFNAPAEAPELAPLRAVLASAAAARAQAPATYPATGGAGGEPCWVVAAGGGSSRGAGGSGGGPRRGDREGAPQSGPAIDLIWVAGLRVVELQVLDHGASDHRLVQAVLGCL